MQSTLPRVCQGHAHVLHQAEEQFWGQDDKPYVRQHLEMTVIGFQVNGELSEQFYERAKRYGCDICWGRVTENDILKDQGFM